MHDYILSFMKKYEVGFYVVVEERGCNSLFHVSVMVSADKADT